MMDQKVDTVIDNTVNLGDYTVGKQTHDLTVTASDSKTTQDRGR
jgi:hypothetical protein